MANQVVVTNSGNVQVSIEPPPNVQVQISRAAIGNITVSNVSTANFANYAGNVVNANQPNITSLGTLTGLTSSGNITAPFFLGNVIGNISGNLVVPGSNTSVLYNNQGNAGASDAFQFNQASNTVTIGGNLVGGNISGNGAGIANIAGANVTGQVSFANVANSVAGANVSGEVAFANTANNVAGANVSGQVAFANTANSVAVGNVVGIGNIATVNLDGNASNILYGNGSFAAPAVVNNVANANYANFAGTAFSVAGANVTGTVANANYAAYAGNATVANSANSVAGANVTGTVANANYASFAGTAFSVSGSNVSGEVANANYATFAGTAYSVSGSNVSGTVANANYAAYAGDVINASQPNITSVGNLSALTVTGNISAGNINGGNLISANYLSGDGYLISNLSVGAGSQIVNGNSNVTVTANSNVNTSVAGVANVYVVTSTGANLTGNLQVTGNVSGIDSLTFDTANAGNGIVAQMSWDDGQGTVDLVLKGGNVTAKLAEQEYARVYNAEANTLSKGEIVYVYGAQGNLISVKRAQANVEATSNGTLGMVAETITAGGEGFVQTSGAIYKLNTNGLTAGNAIYLSPSTPGAYTQTKPAAPDQLVILGWVERVSTTVGSIYLKVDNGYELEELHNVSITSPTTGQALVYNGSNLWVNGNPNVANIANVAYSVSGSNVTGTVANANYAAFANVANSANSVAVGNVVGIGNIATINLDGNASNVLLGNGVFAAPATQSILANGTSNVSIPSANGTINFSANNNSNLVTIGADTNSLINAFPLSTQTNSLRFNSIGNPVGDGGRVTFARYETSVANSTSVQPNANVGTLIFFAHNGTGLSTTFPAFIRGKVDASYTANTANIPYGLQFIVAQTTQSGNANTNFTHNFFSNGNVTFAKTVNAANISLSGNANITGTANIIGNSNVTNLGASGLIIATGNVSGGNLTTTGALSVTGNANIGNIGTSGLITATGNVSGGNITTAGIVNATGNVVSANLQTGNATFGNGSSNLSVQVTGDKTPNSSLSLTNAQFTVVTDTPSTTAYTPFRFNYYDNNAAIAPNRNFRARGTFASPTSVQVGDDVALTRYVAYGDSGNPIVNLFDQSIVITQNNLAGNVLANLNFTPTNTASNIVFGTANTYATNMVLSGNLSATGNVTGGNISSNGIGNIGNLQLNRFQETVYAIGNTSGTITPDFNNGSIQSLTLTGNVTINSLSNAQAGRSMTLIITQDTTGNRTLSSTMKFAGGSKTLSTGANSVDIISVFYSGTTYYAALTTGYA